MNKKANQDIRQAADRAGVRLWQIANKLGVTETTLIKKMRFELPDEMKKDILVIIKELEECEV